MAEHAQVLGLKPWFPWPMSRWAWLTKPVRAERLAALRIGLASYMLLDVFFTLFLASGDLFGPGTLGEPSVFSYRYRDDKVGEPKRWSLLRNRLFERGRPWSEEEAASERSRIKFLLGTWVFASGLLLVGFGSRLGAAWCWAMSVSVQSANPYIDNAGDTVRTLTLFYLMFCPCGAAWSVEAWLRRRYGWAAVRDEQGGFRGIALVRREVVLDVPFFVHPWPLCLMMVQMMMIYLLNGLYKAAGKTWEEGSTLYYVMSDLTLTRWSYAWMHAPYELSKWLTWTVLWWELLFAPLMLVPWRTLANLIKRIPRFGVLHVLFRWNREIVLAFGAAFHLGILIGLELGGFAVYMLCLYLPYIPWERIRRRPDVTPSDPSIPEPAGAPGAEG